MGKKIFTVQLEKYYRDIMMEIKKKEHLNAEADAIRIALKYYKKRELSNDSTVG